MGWRPEPSRLRGHLNHRLKFSFGRTGGRLRLPSRRSGSELTGFDAQLGAENDFLVDDLAAVFGSHPVVTGIVGDVDDLLAKAEIGAHFPRAQKILTKVRMGKTARLGA